MGKNTKARKFDNPKSVGMRKKTKTRKFEKTENTEKVKKGAENLISRSWGKKRENVIVKKGKDGDKAETHSVSICRASATVQSCPISRSIQWRSPMSLDRETKEAKMRQSLLECSRRKLRAWQKERAGMCQGEAKRVASRAYWNVPGEG